MILAIYLIGFITAYILCMIMCYNDEGIKIGTLFVGLLFAIPSWVIIIVFGIVILNDKYKLGSKISNILDITICEPKH